MYNNQFTYQSYVKEDWVDYNHHMNDAEYNRVFSDATDAWLSYLGLNIHEINQLSYTIFTLENHVLYLKEMTLNELINIDVILLDYDQKRLHVFMEMKNADNKKSATYEVMLMGIDTNTNKPAPFPEKIKKAIEGYATVSSKLIKPDEIGHTIEIKRK